ncbi:MAG: tape measure protein [Bacteroidales bacterium]|nr:tape measure protein [Bacteroidales bacterium]
MQANYVNFTINIDGNAYKGMVDLNDSVEKVTKSVENATSGFKKLGANALRFDVITSSIDKISQGFQSLVGSSLDFEQQQANLRTLLNGDAEATDKLVKKIREYGKATVYSRATLVEAQKTMMSFGLESNFAFEKLKNIGDIALGDSQKMASLSLAFSQATSTGKLMGQDLLQMINAGFNPLEVISQKTGKSMAVLKDEMSKGAISADMLSQALEWATEEGGRFYKGAETAAETTSGKIAKMQDTVDDIKVSLFEATGGATAYIAEIGKMIVPLSQLAPIFVILTKLIRGMSRSWGGFVKSIRVGVLTASLRLGVLKYSIASAGGMFQFLRVTATSACRGIGVAIMSIPIIGWIAAIIALLIAVFRTLWNKSEGFRNLVKGTWASIKAIIHNVGVFFKIIFSAIFKVVKGVINSIVYSVKWMYDGIVRFITPIVDFFSNIWSTIVGAVSKAVNWISEKFGVFAGVIRKYFIEPIANAFRWLKDLVYKIFGRIKEIYDKSIGRIVDKIAGLFKSSEYQDVGEAYSEAGEGGSKLTEAEIIERYRQYLKSKGQDPGNRVITIDEVKNAYRDYQRKKNAGGSTLTANNDLYGGSMGNSAGVSAGKAQQINITLRSMVETMNFNGNLKENTADVEANLREMLARILGMAETAA